MLTEKDKLTVMQSNLAAIEMLAQRSLNRFAMRQNLLRKTMMTAVVIPTLLAGLAICPI